MTIHTQCPQCKRRKPAPDEWAGRLVACKDCGAQFQIPAKRKGRKSVSEGESSADSGAAAATRPPKGSQERRAGGLSWRCQACGKQYTVESEWAGRRARCPECGASGQIPASGADTGAVPAADRPAATREVAPAESLPPRPLPGGPGAGRATSDGDGTADAMLARERATAPFSLSGYSGTNPLVTFALGNKLLTAVLALEVLLFVVCLVGTARGAGSLIFVVMGPGLLVAGLGLLARTRRGDAFGAKIVVGLLYASALVGLGRALFLILFGDRGGGAEAIVQMVAVFIGFVVICGASFGAYLLMRRVGSFRVVGPVYLGLIVLAPFVLPSPADWMRNPRQAKVTDASDRAGREGAGGDDPVPPEDSPEGGTRSDRRGAAEEAPASRRSRGTLPGLPERASTTGSETETTGGDTGPEEDVAWSVEPDPAPGPDGPFVEEPMVLGQGRIERVAFTSPDVGRVVVNQARSHWSAGEHREEAWLAVYDLFTGDGLARIDLPSDDYRLADVSPGGKLAALFVGYGRAPLEVWSLEDAEPKFVWGTDVARGDDARRQLPHLANDPEMMGYAQPIEWAGFVDDDRLATASENREVAVWSLPEGDTDYRVPPASREARYNECFPFLTPGRRYLAVHEGNSIRFLEARTGEVRGVLTIGDDDASSRHGRSVAAVTPDGRRLAVVYRESDHRDLGVWDLTDGTCETCFSIDVHGDEDLDWCGGQHLFFGGRSGTRRNPYLIDLARGVIVLHYDFDQGGLAGADASGCQWVVLEARGDSPAILGRLELPERAALQRIERAFPADEPPLIGPGATLGLEVRDLNAPGLPADFTGQVRSCLEGALRERGVTIAPGAEVRLIASCSVRSGGSRTFEIERFLGGGPKREVTVPVTTVECRLALEGFADKLHWERVSKYDSGYPGSWGRVPPGEDPAAYLRRLGNERLASGVEGFFLEAPIPRKLHRQPRYHGTLPGLASWDVDLRQALTGISREEALRGATVGLGPPTADSVRKYLQRTFLDLLADDAALEARMRWFPGAKRPTIGLRFGMGVQVRDEDGPVEIRTDRDLREHTERVGPAVLEGLQEGLENGSFGQWPPAADPRVRDIALLGTGTQVELLDSASRQILDFVVILNLTFRINRSERERQKVVRIRLVDVRSGDTLWSSKSLNLDASSSALGREYSPDAAVADLYQRINNDLVLTAVPLLRAEQVETRFSQLDFTSSDRVPEDVLALVAELRYYQAKRLLEEDEAIPVYDRLLGSEQGRALATGDARERREALRAWLDGL